MLTKEILGLLNRARDGNLNLSELQTLMTIHSVGGTTYQKEIRLPFSSAMLSENLQKLKRKGYLQEAVDKTDLRFKILFVTEKGKKFIEALIS